MIKFIFGISLQTSGLAHVCGHCVTCLTLPQVDANALLFSSPLQLVWGVGEESAMELRPTDMPALGETWLV